MAVKDILDKIVERHPNTIGALVFSEDTVVHNLEAPYDMVSVDDLMKTGNEIFEQVAVLVDEGLEFTELVLEFPHHILVFKPFEEGLLAVLAPDIARGQMVKLQVSLGVYANAIQKALGGGQRSSGVMTVPMIEEDALEVSRDPESDIEDDGRPFMHRPRSKSRSRARSIPRADEAVDATSVPVPKAADAVAEDEALRPDGSQKVKRVYRGAVYYE